MPLIGARRAHALSGPGPRRHPWRFRLWVLASLLIHALIGILLIVTIKRERSPELLPPPATVTMLFDTGKRAGPTLPEPSPQVSPPAAPPQPPPAPPTVAPPTVAPPAVAPPAEVTPSPPEPPPPPAPPLPTPTLPTPPVPPPPLPVPLPKPAPPEPAPTLPRTEEPAPVQPPRQSAKPVPAPKPPPKTPDFPAPMDFSFGKPLTRPPSRNSPQPRTHIPGTIDMSLGPASRGTADPTPRSERDEEIAGADWRNALSKWVADHAYYPEQARRDQEEGDAKVHVIASPDGRVKEVELIGKSGSMWLDLALLALFRDQRIPPLPFGEKEPIEFNFTMHYVLIRR